MIRQVGLVGVMIAALTLGCSGQSLLSEIQAEHDPGRRSEKALEFADQAFQTARESYTAGDIHKGDAELENMTTALNQCAGALDAAHKSRLYKRAELKVALLQRRMQGLLDDMDMQQRGWAEYTSRKLEEIHDRLLDGVMRK